MQFLSGIVLNFQLFLFFYLVCISNFFQGDDPNEKRKRIKQMLRNAWENIVSIATVN